MLVTFTTVVACCHTYHMRTPRAQTQLLAPPPSHAHLDIV
jgi:hypothetical protein